MATNSSIRPLLLALFVISTLVCGGSQVHGLSFTKLLSSTTSKNNAWITIVPALIPDDLISIQECRNSFTTETRNSFKQRISPRFLNADALSQQNVVCILARERLYPWRVLGTADLKWNDNTGIGYVMNVYVREEARGKGVGKRIMKGVEDYASDRRTEAVRLEVDTQNMAAVSLYRQCGYTTPGIHSITSLLGQLTGLNLRISMTKKILSVCDGDFRLALISEVE